MECVRCQQRCEAEILGGRPVGIRIEPATLMFYDLDTRELLRTRANPLTVEQTEGLRGGTPTRSCPAALGHMSQISWRENVADQLSDHNTSRQHRKAVSCLG